MSALEQFEPPKRAKPLINYPHPSLVKHEDYVPVDTLTETNKALRVSAGVGIITAAGLHAVREQKIGPLGTVAQSATTLLVFIAGGGAYKFFSCAFSNIRQRNDSTNHFYAGVLTGSLVGSILTKKLVPTLWIGLGLGTSGFIFHWSGGLLGKPSQSATTHRGTGATNNFATKKSDIVEKQEFWDVARRRPLSQTLEELGEGAFKP